MQVKPFLVAASALVFIGSLPQAAAAEAAVPNLTGTYGCEPAPEQCRSGRIFEVTQSGAHLEFKSDNGDVGQAALTSNISLSAAPPWNTLGVITSPNGVIEWSNGTIWRKR
jgi:hypothetical protein